MNTWVIVLIVVSCVIVLGLIYYFLTKKSNQTEQSNSLTEKKGIVRVDEGSFLCVQSNWR